MRPLILALAFTSTAAQAEPTGAVALYLQATALYATGQASKDPLTVLTAARLLRGLNLTEAARAPAPAPEPRPLTPLTPETILATARGLDAGQTYTDLIAQIATEPMPKPQTLRATAATLQPSQTQTWTLSFFGGTAAELAILTESTLTVSVTDPAGTPLCLNTGTTLCAFTLANNGNATVTVTAGPTEAAYTLLTN